MGFSGVAVVSSIDVVLKRIQMALKLTLKFICLVRDYNTAIEYSVTLRNTRLLLNQRPF